MRQRVLLRTDTVHIVLTPINRLCGVDGSWFKKKLGILVFIKTAPVVELLPWQWH